MKINVTNPKKKIYLRSFNANAFKKTAPTYFKNNIFSKAKKWTINSLIVLTMSTGIKDCEANTVNFLEHKNIIVNLFSRLLGADNELKRNFHFIDSKIIQPNGDEFIAKGINIPGPNYWDTREITQDSDAIINKWKFNSVRINTRILCETGKGSDANNDLNKIISTFTKKKIVTIIAVHDKTGNHFFGKKLEKLKEFYKNLAQKYKNNYYVWFDIMNEPGNQVGPKNEQAWLNEHKQVLETIKSSGAKNITLVEDLNYASAPLNGLKNSCIIKHGNELKKIYKNVIFSIHVYQDWTENNLSNFFNAAKKEKLPIIVGEYGCSNGQFRTLNEAETLLKYAKKNKIGTMAWKWYGGPEYLSWGKGNDKNLLTKSGNGGGWYTTFDSTGTPDNLTPFGELVWKDTHQQPSKH